MFTGIVEEVGTVRAVRRRTDGATVAVACATVVADARLGDSINVNGCCLTVTRLLDGEDGADGAAGGFGADLMGETLDRTALGRLVPGAPVNLERALRADARLGGHLVSGHVDAVGQVLAVEPHADWTEMTVSLPASLSPYVVPKGSITVDGTSLTVMAVDDGRFRVGLIPHTLTATVLGSRAAGDEVNLETDVVAKYVERMLRGGVATPYHQEP